MCQSASSIMTPSDMFLRWPIRDIQRKKILFRSYELIFRTNEILIRNINSYKPTNISYERNNTFSLNVDMLIHANEILIRTNKMLFLYELIFRTNEIVFFSFNVPYGPLMILCDTGRRLPAKCTEAGTASDCREFSGIFPIGESGECPGLKCDFYGRIFTGWTCHGCDFSGVVVRTRLTHTYTLTHTHSSFLITHYVIVDAKFH